jgi:hypothetical protein
VVQAVGDSWDWERGDRCIGFLGRSDHVGSMRSIAGPIEQFRGWAIAHRDGHMQYFHGSKASARMALRAMAMIWNFHPYSSKTRAKEPFSQSPIEALNGFQYHKHWLNNLLIASSLNGRNGGKPVFHKLMEN